MATLWTPHGLRFLAGRRIDGPASIIVAAFSLVFLIAPAQSAAQLMDASTPPTSQPAIPWNDPLDETPAVAATQPAEAASTQPAVQPPIAPQPELSPELALYLSQLALESLIDRIAPAVVTIRVDRPGAVGAPADAPDGVATQIGAGVIIREDGMILTSQHVVGDAVSVYVTLHDNRTILATPIAADARSDLAIIRIQSDDLTWLELGDARDLKRGRFVLALGNPLGLALDGRVAVSQGIVSAIARPLPETFGQDEDRYYGDMIQTTAWIGPGSSGGPLVDIHGRVVGIVTAMSAEQGARQGLGFAVPIAPYSRSIIDTLLRGDPIQYGYLGIRVGSLDEPQRRAARIESGRGALLAAILPGGPAERAGLRDGDIILALDGDPIESPDDLVRRVGAAGPGRRMEISYKRGDLSPKTTTARLARRPVEPPARQRPRGFTFRGAELSFVDAATGSAINLPQHALLVLMVEEGSPAARAGLTPGDIIVRIDGGDLSDDAVRIMTSKRGDVLLGLANGGSVLIKPEKN